jgi:hypothetical protein
MEEHGGVAIYFHTLLISAVDRYDWSASRPDSFILQKVTSGAQWKMDESKSGSGYDDKEKKLGSKPGHTARSLGCILNCHLF